jgi:co-chaperonin GroES (HSP10)
MATKIPFDAEVGDRVLTGRYGGTAVKLDKKEYRILSSEDVLGVTQ